MTSPAEHPSTFVARSPTDLVAVVPVVLGFHRSDSVVLLTFGPPGGAFHARVDLPVETAEQEEVAELLVGAVARQRARRAAVLLYTDDVEVAHAQADVLLGRLLEHGVEVIDVLRVDDGRWYAGARRTGHPARRTTWTTHPFTAQRVFEGQVVHRDRAELADTLVGTDEDDAVEVALAATRFADLVADLPEANGRTGSCGPRRGGCSAASGRASRTASSSTARDAGRMLVLASLVPTRDVAWAEITRATSGTARRAVA